MNKQESLNNSHCNSIVMGAGEILSTSGYASLQSPPNFVTDVTSKSQYGEALNTWSIVILKTSNIDSRTRSILHSAGYLIYFNCDDAAQGSLQRGQKRGKLSLNGYLNDFPNDVLVEKIIAVIAKEALSEIV